MKKIVLRFKSLYQNKLSFISLICLTLFTFSLFPIISGLVFNFQNTITYNNVDDNTIFMDYKTFFFNSLNYMLDEEDYSVVGKTGISINDESYYVYISDDDVNKFYLKFNEVYLKIKNETMLDNCFYSNDLSLKTIDLNGKTYTNSYKKVKFDLPSFDKFLVEESKKIILIIDNNFNQKDYTNYNNLYISGDISKEAKDKIFYYGGYDGKTLKNGTKEQLQNVTSLMSLLLIAPFTLIVIISFFIVDNVYEKNKDEDRIKLIYYRNKKYHKTDNLIDYLIIYFIPMLIGIIISIIINKLLNFGIFTLFYIMTQIVSVLLLFLFLFRKRKVGKI